MRLGELAEQAARRTNLPKATCMTLLEAGWSLESDIKAPTRWVEPERVVDRLPIIEDVMRQQAEAQVYGVGGSIEVAVAARLSYDADCSGNNARAWLEAEDRLNPAQYLEYQHAYQARRTRG